MIWYLGASAVLVALFFSSEVSTMSDNPTYDHWFLQYAPAGVHWTVLKKIAMIESSLGENSRVKTGLENPNDIEGSKSYDGLSWGLMQLRPTTARDFDALATPEKLNNPEYSIKIAGLYLNFCKNYILKNTSITQNDPRFIEFLVKSYNQGVGNTLKEINGSGNDFASEYWYKFQDLTA